MPDLSLNRFVGRGTTAERTAFVPDPGAPPAGEPLFGYLWWDTDEEAQYAYDFGLAAWVLVGGNTGIGIVLTSDPVSPADDTWWVMRDGGSPQAAKVRIRIGGVTYTLAEITLP